MNTTPCAVGGRAPPRRSRPASQDLIGAAQLSDLLLELPKPLRLRALNSRTDAVIDLGLLNPAADRLDPVAELLGDPADRPGRRSRLRPQRADHPHRGSHQPNSACSSTFQLHDLLA